MSVFERESQTINKEIIKLVRRLSVLTIEKLIGENVQLEKGMNVGAVIDEALEGVKEREADSNRCEAVLVSGANKGNKCLNKKTNFSDYCSRHVKMMEKKKGDSGKKKQVESIVFADEDEIDNEPKIKDIGNDLYLLDDIEDVILVKENGKFLAAASIGSKGKPILLSSKGKMISLKYNIKADPSKFKDVVASYQSNE